LAIDVNVGIDEMLDTGWKLFSKHFKREELGIKQEFIDKFWEQN
jgi:V/A-type H+-transporting ATPase subunit B